MKKPGEKNLGNVKKDDEEQSRKFLEIAEKLESDKSGRSFRRAIDSLGKKKKDS